LVQGESLGMSNNLESVR